MQNASMKFDITNLLEQWDYQSGQVMVRKFKGKDGMEKIQLRVDLGLLQMNAEGRPDGKRPMGFASWFDCLLHKLDRHLQEHDGDDEHFTLSGEDCGRLQLEVLQYHHRYICLIQLEEYEGATRDTSRNLEVIDFVTDYAETDELADTMEQFRPQVLMLQTRARACRHLQEKHFDLAIREIESGMTELKDFYQESGRETHEEHSPEILSLSSWLADVKSQRPLTRREKLEADLKLAIQLEDFEKAARVRDALKDLPTLE